jgi:hypothetical protein
LIPEALPFDAGGVLVAARWDTLPDAELFLQQLRHLGVRTPVILVTRGDMRSSDRARALFAGFDDVVTDTTGPDEFVARVSAVARRGRSATVPVAFLDAVGPAGDLAERRSGVLDEESFRETIQFASNGNSDRVFSVLLLSSADGELEALANVVSRTMRGSSGDVVGVVGDGVAVYMPGTRWADATPLVRRVTDAWQRTGRRELGVAQLVWPVDVAELRRTFRLTAPPTHALAPE